MSGHMTNARREGAAVALGQVPRRVSQNYHRFEVRPWPSSGEPPTLLWVPCKGGAGSGLQAPRFRPRL